MNLTKKEYLEYFKKVYLIRATERTISEKYSEQKMRCPVHLSVGQEAPSAALNIFLKKSDFAISYHRSHAHYIAKGCSLPRMIAELYGKETGCSKGYGGSMHLIDKSKNFIGSTAIVSSSIPVGAGFAYSLKGNKKKSKVCIYIGDASCEEGVFFETLNFVILKKLPVIFFCENNKYSVYSNLIKRQPKDRSLHNLVSGFGIMSFKLNSSNPILFLKNLKKIMKKNYNQPIFIEVETYRYLEHCGPNNDNFLKYRPKRELDFWFRKDPVILIEKYLIEKKILSKTQIFNIKHSIEKSIYSAFKFAENSKPSNQKKFNSLIY